ncbi:helix-turn-helix domain-containing protein [Zhenhengia yiwuensis]|jgi:transcriptional regulator with XRE-family HTH domain|uniref:Helix-turn-helix transcriptional regulator n=1 Tax=Zhenhengia yiwuensis TaxID=2763666 RepID=A0A926EGP3_9FIRM|nr:helix-turn-helix transcriptional regulator [Zhenhengia yiwuensis]MBS5317494.1 helix-turn-helix transcriptional regulator [Clostridiales bacterium]
MRRKELKLSSKYVCQSVGIAKNTLRRYEQGQTIPSASILEKFKKCLKL